MNYWFDCLNGAHSFVAKKQRKNNTRAYTKEILEENSKDDRFKNLEHFLQDLKDWKNKAYNSQNVSLNTTTAPDLITNFPADEESEVFEGEDDADTPASKKILSRETLEGIKMSTRAIMGAITFLLKEGVEYINARIFTQDPLEQHFSKLRAGQGGSTNPNIMQLETE